MDTSTKVILIAMSVLVTVGLISLAAFNFGMASSTVKTMSNSLTEQSNEWDMSSLASLDGKKLTGSEVASVIRKYKKEYVCRVETVKGGLKDYTSMSAFVNSVDDVNNYINPESLFNCSLQFQGSSISRLEFREISASVDSIISADDAKVFLADNTTQVNNAMGWLEIAEVIKAQDSSGANESKDILAAALGYNASNKSLKDLANEAKGRIENLEQTLEESKDAESVNVTTDGADTDIFEFTSVMCQADGSPISNYEVAYGKKTYVKVTVTLKTSPTDDVETTTNVILTAKPKANV